MIDPLIRKLDQLGSLSEAEKQALTSFPLNVRLIGADLDLIRAGDHPSDCQLILEGFVCRYKTIEDGRRQIVSFHIPGDIVDLNSLSRACRHLGASGARRFSMRRGQPLWS